MVLGPCFHYDVSGSKRLKSGPWRQDVLESSLLPREGELSGPVVLGHQGGIRGPAVTPSGKNVAAQDTCFPGNKETQ